MTDTPTVEIATVKRLLGRIEGRSAYLQSHHGTASIHVHREDWDGLAAVLARLEGLATPAPQPTREALDPDPSPEADEAAARALHKFAYLFGHATDQYPPLRRYVAQEIDRFAAQHSTAAPVSGARERGSPPEPCPCCGALPIDQTQPN